MSSAIKKVNMISQIVRLRRFVRRWRVKTLSRRSSSGGRTPSGSLAVYVGPNRTRFVVPTRFLNFPVFVDLLREAEEEFGFQSSGGLALPSDPEFFGQVVALLEEDEEAFCGMGVEEFVNVIAEMELGAVDPSASASGCKESSPSIGFAPLMRKTRA